MTRQGKQPPSTTSVADAGELQRRSRELSILKAIAEALNREVDLNHALQVALSRVVELFDLRDNAEATQAETAASLIAALPLYSGVRSAQAHGNPGGFFSSHTSSAFSAATVLEREYGLAVGVPAYLLASFVGYDRIRTDLHYPGDVLVGAGFGILLSNLVYDKNLGREGYYRRRYRVEAMPVVDEETVGFQVSVR